MGVQIWAEEEKEGEVMIRDLPIDRFMQDQNW